MKYPHIQRFRLDTTNEILAQIVHINDRLTLVQSDLLCNIPERASLRLYNAGQALHEVQELERMLARISDELLERVKELKKKVTKNG